MQGPRVAWTDEGKPSVDRPAEFRLLEPHRKRSTLAKCLDDCDYALAAFAQVIAQLHEERS